jgi:hypothetical protein
MFEVRRVAVVQSNAIVFHTDEDKLSWLHWPKSSDLLCDTENGFGISLDDSFTNSLPTSGAEAKVPLDCAISYVLASRPRSVSRHRDLPRKFDMA